MSSNIVYLLGAGASAQSLPLVADFNERLHLFLLYLEGCIPIKENIKIYDDLKALIKEEEGHYSIDTLAKKFWLAESFDEYYRVKALMTCFFIFESFKKSDFHNINLFERGFSEKNKIGCNTFIDKRYDALLATIAKKENPIKLPSNVTFISWNYDDQLEQSAWEIANAGKKFKFYDYGENIIKSISSFDSAISGEINLIKLNGGFKPNKGLINKKFHSFLEQRSLTSKNINILVSLYDELIENPKALNIQFAWDNTIKVDARIKLAKEKVKAATDLVIIGYSFPNYNVEVDKMIFEGKEKNLKNIYIEDTKDNFEALVDRLEYLNVNVEALRKQNKIKHYSDLKSFCLPPSYFVEYKSGASISKKSLIT